MKKIYLGKSGVQVSELCFGTDLIGSRIDQNTSYALLDLFREHGGTFIDTANFYSAWVEGCSGGESETTIGRWMKDRGASKDMDVASKLGFDYPGSPGGLTAAEIERECEKSLRRLQIESLAIYYAHRDDAETPLEETMAAFDRLIQSGKVRSIGASNLKVWRIAEANTVSRKQNWAPYSAVEQRHTYLRPRHGADFGPQVCINNDLKDYCRSREITMIGYSILMQGAYTRSDRPVPAQYAGPESDARLEALRSVAAEVGASENQVVVAWMRQSDPPVLPVIAGSRPEQLLETIGGLDVTLTPDQMQTLDSAGNPDVKKAWLR